MRTDLKIGVVVGLLVATVAVIWIAVRTDPKDNKPVAAAPPAPVETVVTLRDPVPLDAPAAPETPAAPAEPAPQTPPVSDRITIDPLVMTPPAAPATPATPAAPPAGDPLAAAPPVAPPVAPPAAPQTPVVEDITQQPPVTRNVPEVLQPDIRDTTPPVVTPVAGAPSTDATTTRTYVVAAGDNGFWSVAKKMYGDGKHMDVVAKANPQVDPETLRPGQKLTIPPLPQKAAPAGGAAVIGAGLSEVAPLPGGQRVYVVKEGDAGFWGVSVAVYGHGKYYKTIEKANPGVNSDSLSVGTKLVVPPKPEEQPAGAGVTGIAAGAAADTTAVPANYRTYVVADGDAGFWDVAVKMYNDGTLYPAIAKANPGVQSRRMRIGHKLRIPPLEEARRTVAGGASVEDRPAVPSGEPAPIRDVTPPDRPATPRDSDDVSRPDFGR